MNVFLATLAGAVTGAGLWALLATARKPSLHELLPPPADEHPAQRQHQGWKEQLTQTSGALLGHLGWPTARCRQDLAVCDRDADSYLREKILAALGGAAAFACVVGASIPEASGLSPGIALLLALTSLALCLITPDLVLRHRAERRRAELRTVTSAIADLVGVALAGGAGASGALTAATRQGIGPAFTQVRRSLNEAHLRTCPPWDALSDLAQRTGVPELDELAASIRLAGTDGARVRASVTAKAKSLRTHQLSALEAEAGAATERMSLPVLLLVLGVLLLMGIPAVAHVTSGF